MRISGYKKLEVGGKALLRGNVVEIVEIDSKWAKVFHEGSDKDTMFSAKVVDLKPQKMTTQERFFAQVANIRATPLSYYLAGWIAGHESIIHVSTPPKDTDKTIEELDAHKVDYVLGQTLTETTDKTQGRTFTVRTQTPDKALSDLFATQTSVNTTIYFETSTNVVSLNAKEFVLGFLLDDLRFKLGKAQDLTIIRSRVPVQRTQAFEAGLNGAAYSA